MIDLSNGTGEKRRTVIIGGSFDAHGIRVNEPPPGVIKLRVPGASMLKADSCPAPIKIEQYRLTEFADDEGEYVAYLFENFTGPLAFLLQQHEKY